MGHVTNQYYEIMQKTGMASIVALTTKKSVSAGKGQLSANYRADEI